MRSTWGFRSLSPDSFALLYDERVVADVWWIRSLRHPTLTMHRIVDGLNGAAGPQPPRTWAFGTEGSLGRWELLHNGATAGEVAFHQRLRDPQSWLQRILDGLNRVIDRDTPNPEPIPVRRVEERQVA